MLSIVTPAKTKQRAVSARPAAVTHTELLAARL